MRIAVAQAPGVRLDQWRHTLDLIDDLIGRAAELRAELVVLAECVWPAYCLGSREEYWQARAAGLPGPDVFLSRLRRVARRRAIAVCAGYVAEDGDRLRNAAALIDAGGRLVGTYCKCFLWDFDHDYFEPGERIAPLDSGLGRVGLMICADARLPEIPATLAASGARLLLHPTAWVNAGRPGAPWNPQPDFLIRARAAELGVPIASASKWGAERDATFVGSSLICDPGGNILAQCGTAETTVIAAEVQPAVPRPSVLTPAESRLLLSSSPPLPTLAGVNPLDLWPLPPGTDAHRAADYLAERTASPSAVLAFCCSDQAPGHYRVGKRHSLLTGPTQETLEIDRVRIGSMAGADACRFGAFRCLALQGAHAVVVFGDAAPMLFLQTRACENRVFVIGAGPAGWCLIDPRGQVIAEAPWPVSASASRPIRLDAAQAANKQVAPRTDALAGRRPAQYVL
jgi:predicted amidohydrolase